MKDVFIDEATVTVVAGRGGDGSKSFRHNALVYSAEFDLVEKVSSR